jgi:hypothetical protein
MLEHVGHGFLDAVEIGHLAEHAGHAAFSARPIIAKDVEDKRIIELTGLADGID